MRLGLQVSHRQYVDHMAPIWRALEHQERGEVVIAPSGVEGYAAARGLTSSGRGADLWLSCALRDLRKVLGRQLRAAYMEHGTGLQWYPSTGLRSISAADLVAAPNEFIARMYRREMPLQHVEVIGTPKLDELLEIPAESDGRTVAVSFHWTSMRRARIRPHERFEEAIVELARHYTVIGHGHPHVWGFLEGWWREHDIEPVADFSEVVRRADVYACDHSSTIYEWAAIGRPVVLLDHPGQASYPKVPSGLRYEHHADVGEHATEHTLAGAIDRAFSADAFTERREAITAELYPFLGKASERAVDVLREAAKEALSVG